jgi:mannosidase alpha-like ER degradation enhancer 1
MNNDLIRYIVHNVSFDVNARINVFEANIRVLGGLLSGHFLASDPKLGLIVKGQYKGELLEKALDLGQRLLPAFDTATGIPYAWVNLKYAYLSLAILICKNWSYAW